MRNILTLVPALSGLYLRYLFSNKQVKQILVFCFIRAVRPWTGGGVFFGIGCGPVKSTSAGSKSVGLKHRARELKLRRWWWPFQGRPWGCVCFKGGWEWMWVFDIALDPRTRTPTLPRSCEPRGPIRHRRIKLKTAATDDGRCQRFWYIGNFYTNSPPGLFCEQLCYELNALNSNFKHFKNNNLIIFYDNDGFLLPVLFSKTVNMSRNFVITGTVKNIMYL